MEVMETGAQITLVCGRAGIQVLSCALKRSFKRDGGLSVLGGKVCV